MKNRLQLAIREARARLRLPYQALGLVAAIAVLAWLGPFDTWGRLSLSDRVAFWTLALSVNWLFGWLVGLAAGLVLEKRGWLAWGATVAGLSAIAGVPGTAVVWGLVAAFMDYRMSRFAEIATLYSQVLVIHLVLNTLITWRITRHPPPAGTRGEAAPPLPSSAPAAPFLERLPARLGRNLLHLHMQDHYVEAHTDEGSDLVLLRFRDALREVAGLDGAQVHRSHWVARAAIAGVERGDGRIALRLVNGRRIPVSRTFAPLLRERGWI